MRFKVGFARTTDQQEGFKKKVLALLSSGLVLSAVKSKQHATCWTSPGKCSGDFFSMNWEASSKCIGLYTNLGLNVPI